MQFDGFFENSRRMRNIHRSVEETKSEQARQNSQMKEMQHQIQNVGGKLDTFASNADSQLKDIKQLLMGGNARKKQKQRHNEGSDDEEENEKEDSGGESEDSDIGRLREAKAEAKKTGTLTKPERTAGESTSSGGDNLFTHMPVQLREPMAATKEAILNVEVHNKLVKFAGCTAHKQTKKATKDPRR